jgi:hypothetical protein
MADDIVLTNSLAKMFRSCPRATLYKHVDLITPKVMRSKPLRRGTWFHEMLEAKYKGESVTDVHKANIVKFGKLFDEEKELLGDLPREMAELYKAYNWHYRSDKSWKVHEVEIKLEAELPNGMQGQGKADMLIENDYGLWAVDHKTHKRLPQHDYRVLDVQSPYYIWLFRQCGIPVQGFIWNYIVPTPPKPLKFTVQQPKRLYVKQPHTDYPTAYKSAEREGMLENAGVQELLARLEVERYDPDRVQTSPVFRRDVMEKSDEMIEQVVREMCHTAERYAEYPWEDRDRVERNVSRNCEWCSYKSICTAELMGLDAEGVRRREYMTGDPYEYYNDTEKEEV